MTIGIKIAYVIVPFADTCLAHGAACIYGKSIPPFPSQTQANPLPSSLQHHKKPHSSKSHYSLFTQTLSAAFPSPKLQHKDNHLPLLPLRRRLHPHTHRRHPEHLGPSRRLGL